MIFRFDILVDNWIYCGNTLVLIGMAIIQYHWGKLLYMFGQCPLDKDIFGLNLDCLKKHRQRAEELKKKTRFINYVGINADDEDIG